MPDLQSGAHPPSEQPLRIDGQSGRIRTYGPLVPNQMRYQTALHFEKLMPTSSVRLQEHAGEFLFLVFAIVKLDKLVFAVLALYKHQNRLVEGLGHVVVVLAELFEAVANGAGVFL